LKCKNNVVIDGLKLHDLYQAGVKTQLKIVGIHLLEKDGIIIMER